jgi:tetratricopeptide (TPR) repeat protein
MNMTAMFLVWTTLMAASPELAQAERLFDRGQYKAVQRAVGAAWKGIPEPLRADGLRLLRRAAFREGDLKGARELADDEVTRRTMAGCTTDACMLLLCDALEAGWYISHERLDESVEAALWYLRYQRHCAHRADEQSRALYIQGLSAMAQKQHADAWKSFQAAAKAATDPTDRMHALLSLVELSARLGRLAAFRSVSDEILAMVENSEGHSTTPGLYAEYVASIGWSMLQLREAGFDAGDPDKFLVPALEIVEAKGPNFSGAKARNIRLNLGLTAIQRGDVVTAGRWIRPIDPRHLTSDELLWLHIIAARAAAMQGLRQKADQHIKKVEALAAAHGGVELSYQAARLRGFVLQSRGAFAEAVTAYQQAERFLDNLPISPALGQGRDHFIRDLQRGVRSGIALQLQLGRVEDAFCTLRLARARVHRGLLAEMTMNPDFYARRRDELDGAVRGCRAVVTTDAREACLTDLERQRRALRMALDTNAAKDPLATPECEELDAPQDGELFLAYMDLGNGWVGIAANSTGTTAHTLGMIDPHVSASSLAQTLLGPFDLEISRAKNVRILATETLHSVDFHMLPWHAEALVAHATVAYGLDLPRAVSSVSPGRRAAVVAADPTGSLSVYQEAQIVRSSLDAAGLAVELLLGGDAVRHEVMPLLGGRLAHFYLGGHAGSFRPGATGSAWQEPEDMWDIVLRLEQNTVIAVEDLLASVISGDAPDVAVLMACKTAITDHGTLSGGIGMAQAFLLRGSSAVIGTRAAIKDSVAHALALALYEEWDPSTPFAAAERLASAQARLLREGASAEEIGKFRVWVR